MWEQTLPERIPVIQEEEKKESGLGIRRFLPEVLRKNADRDVFPVLVNSLYISLFSDVEAKVIRHNEGSHYIPINEDDYKRKTDILKIKMERMSANNKKTFDLFESYSEKLGVEFDQYVVHFFIFFLYLYMKIVMVHLYMRKGLSMVFKDCYTLDLRY
jgi:hypothetical protein